MHALSRRVAERLSIQPATAERQLVRILHEQRTLTLAIADAWATALDTHLGELYGLEVYGATA